MLIKVGVGIVVTAGVPVSRKSTAAVRFGQLNPLQLLIIHTNFFYPHKRHVRVGGRKEKEKENLI